MNARLQPTALACSPRRGSRPVDAELRATLPPALAEWLARHGFPGLQARESMGDTPLMRAAWLGEDATVEVLLAYGASPHAVNDDGNTALWFACQHSTPATVARLLQAGCAIDHANDDDLTCLMHAAACGRLEVLQLLLAYGANAELRAPDGRSALDMLAQRGLQLLHLAHRLPV